MKTDYTARHIRIHSGLREVVETKLDRLERVLPPRAVARVVVTAGKMDVEVEVSVVGKTRTITAAARAADQRTAAQEAMERLAGQVRKTKAIVKEAKKHRASGVRGAGTWAEPEPAPAPVPGPKREAVSPRAMFEEDALTHFAASKREFMVFRDAGSGHQIRFLYRRRDGGFHLVVPE
ncbi:MAG TPA: HPF/RaiA family ribosome-associated protein [Thermoanaerobaculia bacterium]|nr:HPF/RaiA family ribosome-associated protein [Thermoanaerobaculia bacterium]